MHKCIFFNGDWSEVVADLKVLEVHAGPVNDILIFEPHPQLKIGILLAINNEVVKLAAVNENNGKTAVELSRGLFGTSFGDISNGDRAILIGSPLSVALGLGPEKYFSYIKNFKPLEVRDEEFVWNSVNF